MSALLLLLRSSLFVPHRPQPTCVSTCEEQRFLGEKMKTCCHVGSPALGLTKSCKGVIQTTWSLCQQGKMKDSQKWLKHSKARHRLPSRNRIAQAALPEMYNPEIPFETCSPITPSRCKPCDSAPVCSDRLSCSLPSYCAPRLSLLGTFLGSPQ